MKLTMHEIPECTIQQFAEKHDLEMAVYERENAKLGRYFAYFVGVNIRNGSMLESLSGDGETVEEAVENYRQNLSRHLVQMPNGEVIVVPRLIK